MTKKLLVVEDDKAILELISEIFGNLEDYIILCARDVEEALRIAREDNPGIILLDIHLPQIDGYAVCRLVKSDPAMSHVKILILSCIAQDYYWQKAQEAGADGYITKPFSSTTLIDKVEELLRSN